MLEFSNVSITINSQSLLNIDTWQAHAGESIALLGKNGAGKSTMLKAITGEHQSTGNIYFHGRDIAEHDRRWLARHIAVLPQSSSLNFPFSAYEVIELGTTPLSLGKYQKIKAIEEAMDRANCGALAQRPYPMLSGGERQRVHLARVLVQLSCSEVPALMLLDEPTSAQDLAQQHHILNQLKQLSAEREYLCLSVLHDINQAIKHCTRVAILDQGSVIKDGSAKAVMNLDDIDDIWGYRPDLYCDSRRNEAFL